MESGEAANTSEAVKLAGISRSVYYKYKDAVFPYIKTVSYTHLDVYKRQAVDLLKEFGLSAENIEATVKKALGK